MKPLVCAIGVSRKDVAQAIRWMRWVRRIGEQDGPVKMRSMVIRYTRDMLAVDLAAMRDAADDGASEWLMMFSPLPDLQENGYPGSASHLFLRTMEQVERDYPGHPVLWVEADAIPTRPGWFQEIEADYVAQGQPFMGHLELNIRPPHMAGVAVYPPDWRARSPRLANCHRAPDTRQWGRGKGQAFDVYAAPDTLPQAVQARTIQQVWNCPPLTDVNFAAIVKPETALFHQCKTGNLINILSRRLQPA